MRRFLPLLALLAFAPLPAAAAQKPPVVVELFTAQGCSSCRVANTHLADLADDPGVLALTFSVDYWDYLGWRDTFAQPVFAERQKAYSRKLAVREVYTPQVVIDGRFQTGGARADKVDALVAQAAKGPYNAPDMLFMLNGRVAVGSGPAPRGGADVWLIRYDPRSVEITPKKGDNRGEAVTHKNIVRQVARLGTWVGRPTSFRPPKATEEGLRTAIIVQAAKGGRILGVLTDKTP